MLGFITPNDYLGCMSDGIEIPDVKRYELQKLAQKDLGLTMALGLLLSPGAYLHIGRPWLAVINFVTLNYFLTGFLLVPLHTRKLIVEARKELEAAGYDY